MPTLNTPLSSVVLDLIRSHLPDEATENLDLIQQFLEHFDQSGWLTDRYEMIQTSDGTFVTVVIPDWSGSVDISFPDFPYVEVFFAGQSGTEALSLQFLLGQDGPDRPFVELIEITFGLRFRDLVAPQGVLPPVETSYTGGFRLYPGLKLELLDFPNVNLSNLSLGNPGLTLDAQGLQFDLSRSSSIPPIAAMGLPVEFIGVYWREVALNLEENLLFTGFPEVGLTLFDCAIGASGISFRFLELFDVLECLEAKSGGFLVSDTWAFCLQSLEMTVLDNQFRQFVLRGLMDLPLLEGLFLFSFEVQQELGSEELGFDFFIEKFGEEAIQIETGDLPFSLPVLNITIEGRALKITPATDISGRPGIPSGFEGIYIERGEITLPDWDDTRITIQKAGIGPYGFFGQLNADFPLAHYPDQSPSLVGPVVTDFGGFSFGISSIQLQFRKNKLAPGTKISGRLDLPIFADPLSITISVDDNYDFKYEVANFDDFHFTNNCLVLRWTAASLDRLTNDFLPEIFTDFTAEDVPTTMQILWSEGRITEIRLDLEMSTTQSFAFPGVILESPQDFMMHLFLRNSSDNGVAPHRVQLAATLATGDTFRAATNFAWTRDSERELNNDQKRITEGDDPLLSFSLSALRPVTLSLLSFDTQQSDFPKFFKQYEEAITPLDLSDTNTLCVPVPGHEQTESLREEDFQPELEVNLEDDTDQFTLPFLLNDAVENTSNVIQQYVRVSRGEGDCGVEMDKNSIQCPLVITVLAGKLEFETTVDLSFDWERFAFAVEHDEGIKLYHAEPEISTTEFLGLDWHFQGKRDTEGEGKNRYHYLTLVTKNYHYQIKQAPGSVIELSYTKASKDPIVFSVSDFVISPKGVSLVAEVTDQPARLNGIDTRFRFHGTRFEIKENKIQDFTLMGSGPLPPALVGDATVDIFLQFSQRRGALTLISGGAQLQSNKLLDSRGTRFQFRIDAIGLKFVNDGKFHLYFTLTGSASFVPLLSDDSDGPLALLSKIKIDFVECPLTGDASVLAKHISFQLPLPKKVSFDFLGCFEMELRGIGFIPQADPFDGDAAMVLSGQVYFSIGGDDIISTDFDFHDLYIGVPAKGTFIPRISMKRMSLEIKIAGAFRLEGMVGFVDTPLRSGFYGEGMVEVRALPTMAAAFSFLRVRRSPQEAWVRAWFIYLELRKISLEIPIIRIFIREIGFGFGYRYTLVSIREADRINDPIKLLSSLRELSRTQGNLAKVDSWAVDLEDKGESARWTIVFRAMIAQNSVSPPLTYNEVAEKELPCIFLFDALIAFRSDITFYMAVRAWYNTNYNDFLSDEVRNTPLFSGFVLLSPRRKRFLANLSSNPNGKVGDHPPLPGFVKDAISGVEFSVTLLIEPGLFHYEMGWPDRLGYSITLGPLTAELRTGFIFRISKKEVVFGQSVYVRGRLEIDFGVDLGFIGARIYAVADVAYGARYIGVLGLSGDTDTAFYGAIGLDIQVRFSISFWVDIGVGFFSISFSVTFSLSIGFTASLEVGMDGATPPGVRGRATISVGAMGHSVRLNIKIGLNEGAVIGAKAKTDKYLNIGLEASDVKAIPGTEGATASRGIAAASFFSLPHQAITGYQISQPHYSIFIIREPVDGHYYFVLLPSGEKDNGEEETGFLPVPPNDDITVEEDFAISFPSFNGIDRLEQFVPAEPVASTGVDPGAFQERPETSFTWKINWDKEVLSFDDIKVEKDNDGKDLQETEENFCRLRNYFRLAFLSVDGEAGGYFDPPALPTDRETIEDPRVYNPEAADYEAAVQGAVEQFRGSPFFKRDPSLTYDAFLSDAYDDQTTIYGTNYDGVEDPMDSAKIAHEKADQFRGLVIHDLIADVQEYVNFLRENQTEDNPYPDNLHRSLAFQMGLVFRIQSADIPEWLDTLGDRDNPITIRQRASSAETTVTGEPKVVRPFNIRTTDFAENPPLFQRVQQFSDTNMIALTWDLTWPERPDPNCSPCQAEPEHHLQHYKIRRRTIDNSEPELAYTLKNADVLVVKDGGLKALRPRFKLVDHFNQESLAQQAALPEEGRTYLYTITPVDFSDRPGRPLTLLATRYPNLPPRVPTDGTLIARYLLSEPLLDPAAARPPARPELVPTDQLRVTIRWTEPRPAKGQPPVPIDSYRLVFRREETLPTGSYGLDADTQTPDYRNLPLSHARPLPTDIKLEIDQDWVTDLDIDTEGNSRVKAIIIPTVRLRELGILPGGEPAYWHPEAWTVFFQTVSVNKVPSTLAPVTIKLRVTPEDDRGGTLAEERLPGHLEWLPRPLRFPLLPPEDQQALTGLAHFPMVGGSQTQSAADFLFDLDPDTDPLANLRFRPHPALLRAIRFYWNQGPSAQVDYPLALSAGYDLLELDIDAYSSATFADKTALARAVKPIQEVRMVPPGDLFLIPADTLSSGSWEAWYPSTLCRLRAEQPEGIEGSETPYGPWYSWRDSILIWPEWPDNTVDIEREEAKLFFHPFLDAIEKYIESLTEGELPRFVVDRQIPPPLQPINNEQFLNGNAPAGDPYGWGVLQRFGLSVTLGIRLAQTGELILPDQTAAEDMISLIRSAIADLATDSARGEAIRKSYKPTLPADQITKWLKHLHVSLLFQAGQSVALEQAAVSDDQLLAIVQLSLRPNILQRYRYAQVQVEGPANANLEMVLTGTLDCTLINQADTARGEIHLATEETEEKTVRGSLRLPANGKTRLLLRCKDGQANIDLTLKIPFAETELSELEGALPPEISIEEAEKKLVLSLTNLFGAATGYALDLAMLADVLAPTEQELALIRVTKEDNFSPQDERSTYFTVPPNLLDEITTRSAGAHPEYNEWRKFKRLAEAHNSPEDDTPKINIPVGGDDLEPFLGLYLPWSQRFLDHSGYVEERNGIGQITTGPWLVTAYPKAATPAYVTPDEGGRIKYDHLIKDQWAHTYRYYVRPYGRYDLMWESFRQSAMLLPDVDRYELLPETTPEPDHPEMDRNVGGLDVVLDRTKAISAPVILFSGRLDEESTPARPAAPGSIWEVIIAQHPEQILSEKNQTLYRRLSYRQLAFTLLRRLQSQLLRDPEFFQEVLSRQNPRSPSVFNLDYVENIYPAIPDRLPEVPEYTDLTTLTPDEQLGLSIARRIGRFSQRAQVLQWEALPFFYEQKLLVVAQTAKTVSSISSVTQQEFHYRSPVPRAVMGLFPASFAYTGTRIPDSPESPFLLIPIQRFWDALSPAAQAYWPDESPTEATEGRWAFSALPDLETVYQIVERFSGNVEVQTEYFFNRNKDVPDYERRVLAERFLLEEVEYIRLAPDPRYDHFHLVLRFDRLDTHAIPVLRNYRTDAIPSPTDAKITYENGLLSISEVLTLLDIDNILWNSAPGLEPIKTIVLGDAQNVSPETRQAFLEEWYSSRRFSGPFPTVDLPIGLRQKLEFPVLIPRPIVPVLLQDKLLIETETMTWRGVLTESNRLSYLTFRNELPASPYRQAAEELLTDLEAQQSFTAPYLPLENPFEDIDLPGTFSTVIRRNNEETIWALSWEGPMTEEERNALLDLSEHPNFVAGIQRMWDELSSLQSEVSISAGSLTNTPADAPSGFTLKVQTDPQTGVSSRRLIWQGQITPLNEKELETMATNTGDPDLISGIVDLIVAARAAQDQASLSEAVTMSWPLFDFNLLATATGLDLSQLNLSLNGAASQLQWDRSLLYAFPTRQVVARLKAYLHPKDPLLSALLEILFSLDKILTSVTIPQLERVLRIRVPFTESEKEELLAQLADDQTVNRTAIQELYEDIYDKYQLRKTYRSQLCEGYVSQWPADLPESDQVVLSESSDTHLILFGMDTNELAELPGDLAFKNGLQALTEQVSERTVRVTLREKAIPQLERKLAAAGIEPRKEAGYFTELRWTGPLLPNQRAVLLNLELTPSLEESLRDLIREADTVQHHVAIAKGFQDIPAELNAKLTLVEDTEGLVGIRWQGTLSEADLARLSLWAGDTTVLSSAVAELQTLLNNVSSPPVALPPFIPAGLTDMIQLSPGQIAWLNPTADEVPFLEQWGTIPSIPDTLRNAITQLLASFDPQVESAVIYAELDPVIDLRPSADDLPLVLREHLDFTEEGLVWSGFVNQTEQLDGLRLLTQTGDPAFRSAVNQLIDVIGQVTTEVSFSSPLLRRPSTIPGSLAERLLIGRYHLSLVGAIDLASAVLLFSAFDPTSDRKMIQHLYTCSQQHLIAQRDIRIRSRRGAARPSDLISLHTVQLADLIDQPPTNPV